MDDDQERELEALEGILSDPTAEPIKLSYGLLKSVTDNFSNEIGRGGFGVVYMGVLQNGDVAVKKLSNLHVLPDKQFLDEITCLKKANHKNIVRFLGYCSETQGEFLKFDGAHIMADVQKKLLCFEYVPNGNIQHYLQEKPREDDWPVRYKMIRGICQGLHYLHEKNINHLDLKPENVMLDAQMEPKITDFGLSRCLDQGKSMVTQRLLGTPRYIAPEIIDKGEISLKSDIYALGIIIIELLTGISRRDLENWDESLDMECPRVRRCTEIGRNCTDADKHNRPTIREVMTDLDELESSLELTNGTGSSINQVTPESVFPGTELLDVYPHELRFPFVPNQEMCCHLSLTNKTDVGVHYVIIPEAPNRYHGDKPDYFPRQCSSFPPGYRYQGGLQGFLPPMSTGVITLRRNAQEELPLDSTDDKLEVLVLLTELDEDVFGQQISRLSLDKDSSFQDTLKAAHEFYGFELHRAMLTASLVIPKLYDGQTYPPAAGIYGDGRIYNMDVHPMEPWVLIVSDRQIPCIWNWQTKKILGRFKEGEKIPGEPDRVRTKSAKFIARKQWVAMGCLVGWRESIVVCTCPTMDKVKVFAALDSSIYSLAVHPTRPFLLTNRKSTLRLWNWNNDWTCVGRFETKQHVADVMFGPRHAATFTTLGCRGILEMWKFGHIDHIAEKDTPFKGCGGGLTLTYCGDQHFVAAMEGHTALTYDLQKEKLVHALYIEETKGTIVDAVCHPTRPVLVIASEDHSIFVLDSNTYRLKGYVNLSKQPTHIGFTGSNKLVIGYFDRISVIDIDLE